MEVRGDLAARRTMGRERRALLGAERLGARVDRDLAWPDKDADRVLGLADLDRPADQLVRHRVDVAIDVDVALDVDDALVQRVDLGDPCGPAA